MPPSPPSSLASSSSSSLPACIFSKEYTVKQIASFSKENAESRSQSRCRISLFLLRSSLSQPVHCMMMKSAVALLGRSLKQSEGLSASLHHRSASANPAVRVLSTSALTHDDSHHHHHESEKMVSEGGGSKVSFHEKKEEVNSKKVGVRDANQPSKNEWQQTKDSVSEVTDRAKSGLQETKESVSENASAMADAATEKAQQVKESDRAAEAKSVAGKITDQTKKEVNTSSDMAKDMPQKVAETTQDLKEVGVEAVKAVKRDVSHAAEKIGLKNSS